MRRSCRTRRRIARPWARLQTRSSRLRQRSRNSSQASTPRYALVARPPVDVAVKPLKLAVWLQVEQCEKTIKAIQHKDILKFETEITSRKKDLARYAHAHGARTSPPLTCLTGIVLIAWMADAGSPKS